MKKKYYYCSFKYLSEGVLGRVFGVTEILNMNFIKSESSGAPW